MTVAEFADYERVLERRVYASNGMYWRRVRPFFYRPLLPFEEHLTGSCKPPFWQWLGGFQHAVPPNITANSFLNLLMFEDADAYSLDCLDYNRKRQVKLAMKRLVIRPVTDREEFKQQAYPVYLSFYERTRYRYGSQRRNRKYFLQWADALFQTPKIAILGGYLEGCLKGVSISLLVEDTLCYATFFCDTESLRLGLSDLMLHFVRGMAAQGKCARRIFTGFYKGDKGLDDFYLLRGCKLVRKPALLCLNPLTALILKRFAPRQYARLIGEIKDTGNDPFIAPEARSREPGTRVVSKPTTPPEPPDEMSDGTRFQSAPFAPQQ